MYLLDTNIVSELVKRSPNSKVMARFAECPPAQLFLSTVSVFELRYGAARSSKPAALWGRIERDILQRFHTLPFTNEDALAGADLLAPLANAGQNFALQDLWLAGVATSRNLILVTRNRRDFDRIPSLRVENWFD